MTRQEVVKLIEEYLAPEKYAYTDFEHVSDITFGDIRKSGKRYLIINYRNAYQPWRRRGQDRFRFPFVI